MNCTRYNLNVASRQSGHRTHRCIGIVRYRHNHVATQSGHMHMLVFCCAFDHISHHVYSYALFCRARLVAFICGVVEHTDSRTSMAVPSRLHVAASATAAILSASIRTSSSSSNSGMCDGRQRDGALCTNCMFPTRSSFSSEKSGFVLDCVAVTISRCLFPCASV